ncbi:MAG TPA: TatD family hydrolase [Candidatus Polarisedimenticolaceae bacterium]|nr:TatD family hydrolase [Candidatus Polarisedimenticolaceae bacterium]
MIDTHCHLTHAKFAGDAEAVVARAREAGLDACVTIGTGVDDARRAAELAKRHEGFIFATAGLDPFSAHAAGERFDEALASLAELLASGAFRGVGEIGLDYHYDLDPRPIQADRLERQLDLAARLDLPVVIHVREAHDDMASILKGHPRNRGIIHSFTGTPEEAAPYLECGWSLAFNGVLTFKNADDVRDAARSTPSERLLVETDSPYLAPVPHRGARCEPAFVRHTLAALAETRGEPWEQLEATTTRNAAAIFRLHE